MAASTNRPMQTASFIPLSQNETVKLGDKALFVELNPAPVLRCDRDGIIKAANPAAESFLGETAKLGRQIKDALPAFPTIDIGRCIDDNELHQFEQPLAQHTLLFDIRGTSKFNVLHLYGANITGQKQAEAKIRAISAELLTASRRAGMAEVAIGVLHNIGNVLNSVNVSVELVNERIRAAKVDRLRQAVELLSSHRGELDAFTTDHAQGKHLIPYLTRATHQLEESHGALQAEVLPLRKAIAHIKTILEAQQAHARSGGVPSSCRVEELVEEALTVQLLSLEQHGIVVVRDYGQIPECFVDRHAILQIFINLVSNARHALQATQGRERRLTVQMRRAGETLVVRVADNGVGIASEHKNKIFQFGFTTKHGGHGFGLHNSALVAREMGGSLSCHSDGPGTGATFEVTIPIEAKRHHNSP